MESGVTCFFFYSMKTSPRPTFTVSVFAVIDRGLMTAWKCINTRPPVFVFKTSVFVFVTPVFVAQIFTGVSQTCLVTGANVA